MRKNAILCVLIASGALAGIATAATPNFNGTWMRYPDPYASSDPRFAEEPPPPGGEPALKEPYASDRKTFMQRKLAAEKRGEPLVDDSARCLPEGMPTMMGATYNIEIVQTPNVVVVLAEFLSQIRRIYINEKMPPLEDITPSFNGYSIARWEGDTLVIETAAVRDDTRFAPYGIPHSADMKITERLKMTAPDMLENRITIVDPKALSKPYVFTFGYKKDPTYKMMEYICENNRYEADTQGKAKLKVK